MTTLENTISMLEVLPEADLLEIQKLIRKLFQQHKCENSDEAVGKFLETMTEEDFLRDVERAEQEIADGKCRSAEEVFNGLERRYGL